MHKPFCERWPVWYIWSYFVVETVLGHSTFHSGSKCRCFRRWQSIEDLNLALGFTVTRGKARNRCPNLVTREQRWTNDSPSVLHLIESIALRKMKMPSLNFCAIYHDMYLIRPLRMTAQAIQLLKHLVKSLEWKVTGFPYDRWNVLKIFPGFSSLMLYVFIGCEGGLKDQSVRSLTLIRLRPWTIRGGCRLSTNTAAFLLEAHRVPQVHLSQSRTVITIPIPTLILHVNTNHLRRGPQEILQCWFIIQIYVIFMEADLIYSTTIGKHVWFTTQLYVFLVKAHLLRWKPLGASNDGHLVSGADVGRHILQYNQNAKQVYIRHTFCGL